MNCIASSSKKQNWSVYIVKCCDATLYTGITTDIVRRLHEHNHLKKGAKYTRARRPVYLIYQETFCTRSSAARREAAIKKMPLKEKQTLILQHDSDNQKVK